MEELCGSAHALLGHQQHQSAEDQHSAQNIEDRSTHTAGGRQLRTSLVHHIGGHDACQLASILPHSKLVRRDFAVSRNSNIDFI